MSKKILITAPSLDVKDNVSGISSLVRDIIQLSHNQFTHFRMGSKDGLKKDISWAIKQVLIYVEVLRTSVGKSFDIAHVNMGLEKFSIVRDSLAMMFWKRICRKKIILHVHGGYYLMQEPGQRWLKYLLDQSFRTADKIIVLSELEKSILLKRYPSLQFDVFPNAVNIEKALLWKRSYNRDHLRFVFLGRINKSKGIETITEALRSMQSYFTRFTLDIYGAGPDEEFWLESLRSIEGLDFKFHGVTGGSAKWEILNKADVFLLPSLHSEGMPIAMLEAMAAGCVVMVSDVASVRTVIQDSTNGILLPVNQPKQLAIQMIKTIEGQYDLEKIGSNAKEYIADYYSFESYVSKLDALYASL